MSEEKPYGIHIVGGDIFINDKWIRVYDYVQDLQSQLADAKAEVERLREEATIAKLESATAAGLYNKLQYAEATITQQSAKIDALREALERAKTNFDKASVSECQCGSISSEHGCLFCDSFERTGTYIDKALALTTPPEPSEPKEK